MSGGEERYWPRPQNPNTRKILCFTGGQRSWAQSPDVLAQGELVGWKVRGPCRKVWKKHPPALCFLERLHQGLRTQAQVQVPQPPEKKQALPGLLRFSGRGSATLREAVSSTVFRVPWGLGDYMHKCVCICECAFTVWL